MYAKSVIHRSWREGVWLLLSLSFYLGFVLADGPVLCVDTQSYLDMDYSREPLYPLFLAGLQAVFGTAPSRYGADIPRYLVAAVLVQAVAMAVCVWYFVRVIGSTAVDARGEERSSIGFRKAGGAGNASAGRSGEREGFRTFLLFSICWGVDLLNRFAARRGSMYMESIMTESFPIPLFLVFLACAYLFFRTHRPGRLIACSVLMLVLISLRKQMAVSAVILVCFSLLYDLIRQRRWKPFAACVLAAGIAFGGAALADYSYNYALRGVWMHKTHNYKGADCTLIYTARAEDASLFDDPEEQELFAKKYSECRARGLTWEGCQTSGWIGRAEHFAQSYSFPLCGAARREFAGWPFHDDPAGNTPPQRSILLPLCGLSCEDVGSLEALPRHEKAARPSAGSPRSRQHRRELPHGRIHDFPADPLHDLQYGAVLLHRLSDAQRRTMVY
ncbi:MAG: hypothetical protein SPL56_09040 [Lachnospiraceae bacterium]|nr:hypothetical protein [Lachnospiraceae bacterium]